MKLIRVLEEDKGIEKTQKSTDDWNENNVWKEIKNGRLGVANKIEGLRLMEGWSKGWKEGNTFKICCTGATLLKNSMNKDENGEKMKSHDSWVLIESLCE